MKKSFLGEPADQAPAAPPVLAGSRRTREFTYFLQALDQAAERKHFDTPALSRVEWGWNDESRGVGMFGWIVVLRTGRRFYLEMAICDGDGREAPIDLEIAPLASQQLFPEELEGAVLWNRPDHINFHLGLRGAVLN